MKHLFAVFLCLCGMSRIHAQTIGGLWQGNWASPSGYVFGFVLQLDESADGTVEGFFHWRFDSAPAGDTYYHNRLGQEATEYLKGRFEDGVLALEGYKKDDPKAIIALDTYELVFDTENDTMTGESGPPGIRSGMLRGTRIGLP